MDDMQRRALEQEFEEASAKLTDMMARMDDMQTAYAKYEAAARAGVVAAIYDQLREEQDEFTRMQGRVAKAREERDAAEKTDNKARIAAAREALEAEELALAHAKELLERAQSRFDEELARQGFDSLNAMKAAFLAKPAFMKLEEELRPFSEEYAALLRRCEEIDVLLNQPN